ncbi:MAG: di-trans,poly-cis-decaprenylcistransferase [Gammaproteobacteria bacterium]|nr:di-trans,poly-cis-decaprenylcistransferase [Gammaproteobacteria bacterium]
MVASDQGGMQAVPRHVAVIMDGNGRWAERRALPRAAGHRAGARAVRATIEHALRRGIAALTLFAFSSENWQRPAEEVGLLMQLLLEALDREVAELGANGVRLHFAGDRSRLAPLLVERMDEAARRTAGGRQLDLLVAVAYGGRWDIVQAARTLAAAVAAGRIDPAGVDETTFAASLATAGRPEPDLFIRTGGERRISNFLLWDLAYTELWFSDTLWPDFDERIFDAAISDFASRQRRFGRTAAQVGRS